MTGPRSTLSLAGLVALPALLLGACGGGSDDAAPAPAPSAPAASSPSSPSIPPPSTPSPSTPRSVPPGGDATTCREVRAGIDAFNRGDYEATVRYFEKAVPLAEAAASSDSSQAAQDLLEAVRYYAELPAAQYPPASVMSPDFERYKQITLGQCEAAAPGGGGNGGGGHGGDGGGDGGGVEV